MMRKIFVSLLLLVSGYAMAQPANYVPYASRNRYIALMADSTFHIPRFNGAPSLRTGGSTNDGALAADTANNRLYIYNGGSWTVVNKDTSNTFLNSLYKKSGTDSVFQIKGGTHTFAFTVGGGGSGDGIASLGTSAYGLTTQNDSTYKVDTSVVSTKLWRQKGIDSVQANVNLKLNISDTATMLQNYVRAQRLADTASAIRASITGGGDTSTFIVDTTFKRLAYAINEDSLRLKSVTIDVTTGQPASYEETDSTLKFTIPQFDSEIYGVVPPSTGTTTDFLRADGTWAAPAGGGGADTIPYSHNPADWLVSLPHRSVPYFYTSGVAGDPTGSYYESSMYTPTPVHITNGTNKGKIFVVTKGDFNRKLFGWISSDKGFTWDTTGIVLQKSSTGWDKSGVSMAHMVYDSLTNVIHMWYMGYSDSLYPSVFGVGYATASGDAPSTFTKQGEVLSGQSFATQIGMPHKPGYLKVSSVVKGRETGKYYFHGSYWIGNASTWPDSTIRLWQGVSSTISGNIDSCQEILAPTGTNTLLENPTVWHHDDGNYWMILTNGYTDLNGGIDSVQYLQTAKSASLKTPVWTVQPGIVFYPTRDSTWMGKRVYNAQLLKNTSDYYDRPISLLHDSSGRDTDNLYETQWMLFYSASYPNSYHDQASIIRLTPQKQGQYTASIGYNGSAPNILQKNGSIQVNIPFVDTTRRYSGGITWEQIRDLYRSVKTGTMGRLAYYDSSLRRVRDLPTFSVTVGTYPTFTFGASGYNAASVYFRNGVGTTGMISEDGGMNYYGSSTYTSHYFRDKVSGGIVLSRLFSSGGASYAYFTGKTAFGSTATATSHLQTDKTFAGIMSAAKTSAYTIADDYSIPCDATSAAFTVTLPQANGCPGRIYIIKKIDSSGNAVTLDGSGTEPIDGALTYDLGTQWKYVIVQSTGSASTGWYIIGGN